jgi:hypothetical protein
MRHTLNLLCNVDLELIKLGFLSGIFVLNEEHVDVAVHKLVEETDMTMAIDDSTLLSGAVGRIPLPIMYTCMLLQYMCRT